MRFKTWLASENVIGPGGGVDDKPADLEALSGEIAKHGAGAFPSTGNRPVRRSKTAATPYADKRFMSKKH